MRTANRAHILRRDAVAAAAAAGLLAALAGCLTLTPIRATHVVSLSATEPADAYQVDPVDGSVAFVHEGLRLRVSHLESTALEREIPGAENPFVFREVDYDRGYRPQRFTVFQVTVNNPTFDKVLLEPQRAFLVTEHGKVMKPYALTRADAKGDPRNFETYWLSRGVQSGNSQKLYLERMAVLRGSLYQFHSFVFKGNSYSGKLVFDPLPVGTERVTLHLERFVVEFGIYDTPKTQLDLAFPFAVRSQIAGSRTEPVSVVHPNPQP